MAAPILYLLLSALMVATVKTSLIKPDVWRPREEGSARIVNGYQAGVGQFPYQALVLRDGSEVFGGSLITPTAVLTVAFAIATSESNTWTIRLGGIHRTEDESTAWISVSRTADAHPNYNSNGHYSYNVAVIFLPVEAPLSRFINLVALPSFNDVDDDFVGESALISGWGYTDDGTCCPEILLWTEVTVVENSVCAELYEPDVVVDSTLCAGNEYGGSCNADHGGALVVETEDGYKQIAVASFNLNNDCRIAGVPGGFTRITSVLDWIATTAGIEIQ